MDRVRRSAHGATAPLLVVGSGLVPTRAVGEAGGALARAGVRVASFRDRLPVCASTSGRQGRRSGSFRGVVVRIRRHTEEFTTRATLRSSAPSHAVPVRVDPRPQNCRVDRHLIDARPMSGTGGIRTPGPVKVVRFQGGCIRPLCHRSADDATGASRVGPPGARRRRYAPRPGLGPDGEVPERPNGMPC